jgi:Tol biopolymer transport system component
MPDFDFDTRTPQEPKRTIRLRIAVIANKLRTLSIATRPRIQLIVHKLRNLPIASKLHTLTMANTLRGSLMANRLRSLLIGGVLLFVAVAAPVGLLIYSSGGMGDQQQKASGWIGDQRWKAKDANLKPLAECPGGGGGHKREVLDDDASGKKIVFARFPQSTTTFSSDGRIMSDNPGRPNIGMYVVNVDGSGLTLLNRTTATEFRVPNRLPDGRKIEIIGYSDPDVVGSPEYGEYVCSPDGKKLASVTSTTRDATDDDSSAPPADEDISVRTSAGTIDLGEPGYDYSSESSPIFSPDSQKLAFQKDSQLYVANADGSDQRQRANNFRYIEIPVFSPDSKKIAFLTDTPGPPDSTDLYVINVDGSNLTRLTHNTKRFGEGYSIQEHIHNDGGIWFSPDSKKIAFMLCQIVYTPYTPSGHREVRVPIRYDMYVVNVDGTRLTRLTHTEAQEERIITWVGGEDSA